MAQLVVRDLEDSVKKRLKQRADRHGRSMEEEIRDILRDAVKYEGRRGGGLGTRLANRFAGRGIDFDMPEIRGELARPASFKE
jgi:plasmid stability protein